MKTSLLLFAIFFSINIFAQATDQPGGIDQPGAVPQPIFVITDPAQKIAHKYRHFLNQLVGQAGWGSACPEDIKEPCVTLYFETEEDLENAKNGFKLPLIIEGTRFHFNPRVIGTFSF
jgi:hypothetical protein